MDASCDGSPMHKYATSAFFPSRASAAMVSSMRDTSLLQIRREVFVAAAREAQRDHGGPLSFARDDLGDLAHACERVCGLERGQDPFGAREELSRGERAFIGRRDVTRAAGVFEM